MDITITVHLAESGLLSKFQAYQETGHRATALPGELGQAAVEETSGLVSQIGSGLGGLVQGLVVDLINAVVLADKEQDHRRPSQKEGHLEDLLGEVAHGQANEEGRANVGQEKGSRKDGGEKGESGTTARRRRKRKDDKRYAYNYKSLSSSNSV